jgi:hypothetical protein
VLSSEIGRQPHACNLLDECRRRGRRRRDSALPWGTDDPVSLSHAQMRHLHLEAGEHVNRYRRGAPQVLALGISSVRASVAINPWQGLSADPARDCCRRRKPRILSARMPVRASLGPEGHLPHRNKGRLLRVIPAGEAMACRR